MVKSKFDGALSAPLPRITPLARATPTSTLPSGFLNKARKRRAVECCESMRHAPSCARAAVTEINPPKPTNPMRAYFLNILHPLFFNDSYKEERQCGCQLEKTRHILATD